MLNLSRSALRSSGRAPVIGAAFGLLLVLSPILLGARSNLIFFSLGGLVIVVGGVIAVAFMSFSPSDVRLALLTILRTFQQTPIKMGDLSQDMAIIVKWSNEIRTKGLRHFEASIRNAAVHDPIIQYGLNMVVSEYSPDEVRNMIITAANACYDRDSRPADILDAMTSHAPAFGMVGTLIGMVAMLSDLTDNISRVGPSLAVAFLCTLYGVLSARMIYMPAASRFRQNIERQRFRNHFIAEGMAMLAGKKPSMYVQDRLNGFLQPEEQDYFRPLARHSKSTMGPVRLKVVNI